MNEYKFIIEYVLAKYGLNTGCIIYLKMYNVYGGINNWISHIEDVQMYMEEPKTGYRILKMYNVYGGKKWTTANGWRPAPMKAPSPFHPKIFWHINIMNIFSPDILTYISSRMIHRFFIPWYFDVSISPTSYPRIFWHISASWDILTQYQQHNITQRFSGEIFRHIFLGIWVE